MATSLKIDEDMKARIRQLAETRDRSAHWIMREAIREYVEREEQRESFRKEAVDSWHAYRENGRHLTGHEVADWLQRWGDDAAEPPACND